MRLDGNVSRLRYLQRPQGRVLGLVFVLGGVQSRAETEQYMKFHGYKTRRFFDTPY